MNNENIDERNFLVMNDDRGIHFKTGDKIYISIFGLEENVYKIVKKEFPGEGYSEMKLFIKRVDTT